MKKRVTKKMKDAAMDKIQRPEGEEKIRQDIDEILKNAQIAYRDTLREALVRYVLNERKGK